MKARINAKDMNTMVIKKTAFKKADKEGNFSLREIDGKIYIWGTMRMWTCRDSI